MAETGGRKWTLVNEDVVELHAVMDVARRLGLHTLRRGRDGGWRATSPRGRDEGPLPPPEYDPALVEAAVQGGRWIASKVVKEIRKEIGSGAHQGDSWGCVKAGDGLTGDAKLGDYVTHLMGDIRSEAAKGRDAYVFGYAEGDFEGRGPWFVSSSEGLRRTLAERLAGDGGEVSRIPCPWSCLTDMVAKELPPRAGETPEARAARLSALGLSGRKPKASLAEELKSSRSTLVDLAAKGIRWDERMRIETSTAQTTPVGEPIPDGRRWFRLTGPEALDYESDRMAHCVGHGRYDGLLTAGLVRIYSLRREREGALPKPNLTVRVTFLDEATKYVLGDDLGKVDVVQVDEIKGFANRLPTLPGKNGGGQGKEEPELDKEALAAVASLVNAEFPGKQVRWREPAIGGSGTEYVLDGGRWTLFRGWDDPASAEMPKLDVGGPLELDAKGGRVWLPRELDAEDGFGVGFRLEGASVAALPERVLVNGREGNLAFGRFGETDVAFVGCTLEGRGQGSFLVGRHKDGSVHVVDVADPRATKAAAGVLSWFEAYEPSSNRFRVFEDTQPVAVVRAPEIWLPSLRTDGRLKVEGRLMGLPSAMACGTLDLSEAKGPDGKPYPLHGLLDHKNFHVDFIRWGNGPGQEACFRDVWKWSAGRVANGAEFKEAMEFVSKMSVRDPKLAALVGRGLERAMRRDGLVFNPSVSDAKGMVRFCRIASALGESAPRIARRLAIAARSALEAMPEPEREQWAKRNPCSAKVVATVGRRTVVEKTVETVREVAAAVRTGVSKGWAAAGAKASKSVGKGLGGGGIGL